MADTMPQPSQEEAKIALTQMKGAIIKWRDELEVDIPNEKALRANLREVQGNFSTGIDLTFH